jgi:hypothetical protein
LGTGVRFSQFVIGEDLGSHFAKLEESLYGWQAPVTLPDRELNRGPSTVGVMGNGGTGVNGEK